MFLYSVHAFILGGISKRLAEYLAEVVPAGESAFFGHFIHGQDGVGEKKGGMGDPQMIQIPKRCQPCFFHKQAVEIRGGDSQQLCQILNGEVFRKMLLQPCRSCVYILFCRNIL